MSNLLDLKQAERKAFTASNQDGLWDIGLGGLFLIFVIAPYLSESMGDFWSSAILLPFWALSYAGLRYVRVRIVRPRLGTVKFGSWRIRRLTQFNLLSFVFLSLALILGFLSFVQFETIPGWVHTARLSLILLVGFGLAAYFLDFPRLYFYSVLVAAAPLVGEWLWQNLNVSHHGFPITFGAVSGLMILIGSWQLYRVIRDHPLPADSARLEGTSE